MKTELEKMEWIAYTTTWASLNLLHEFDGMTY